MFNIICANYLIFNIFHTSKKYYNFMNICNKSINIRAVFFIIRYVECYIFPIFAKR